jgi:hypothetical protein
MKAQMRRQRTALAAKEVIRCRMLQVFFKTNIYSQIR